MWHDAALVAGKDLRIELRSRVLVNQVAPFGVLVLVLFAFALGPDAQDLVRAAPGVFWVAVLFAGLLAIQRAFAIESSDGRRATGCVWRASTRPASFSGRRRQYPRSSWFSSCCSGPGPCCCSERTSTTCGRSSAACVAGTAGLAGSGVLYGALAAGLRVRETSAAASVLPVVAPGARGRDKGVAGGAADRERECLRQVAGGWLFCSCSPRSTWCSGCFCTGSCRRRPSDRTARGVERSDRFGPAPALRRGAGERTGPSARSVSAAVCRRSAPCGSAYGSRHRTRCREIWCASYTSTPRSRGLRFTCRSARLSSRACSGCGSGRGVRSGTVSPARPWR